MSASLLRGLGFIWALAGLASSIACGAADRRGGGAGGSESSGRAGRGGDSAGAPAQSGAGSGGIVLIVGNAGDGGQGADSGTCLADSREGTRPATSLYFLVDTSDSMHCQVPNYPMCDGDSGEFGYPNRWDVTKPAIEGFFAAKESAGLWSGFTFFPHVGSIADCDLGHYAIPTEEMALLPGAAPQLKARLDGLVLDGSTPTKPALEGALQYARDWSTAHAGLSIAVVLATDGYPSGCEDQNNTLQGVAEVARAAYAASPSVPTYVLGDGSNLADLDQVAEAGGTSKALLVDISRKDVTAQLLTALGVIRDEVFLNCTYTIPEPSNGKALDFGLVNVRYTTSDGKQTSILQDPSAGECKEGWQYTADRTQIKLCGDACKMVKGDVTGRLDVLFGCLTKIAPPPK